MIFSFLGLRWRLRGIEPDPGPFGPQHGATWMTAPRARWHGHWQSLRNIIGEFQDQCYHPPVTLGVRSMSGNPTNQALGRDSRNNHGLIHGDCLVARLLQLGVFRLGFLQNGDVGIGVFPQREEILIRGAGFDGVALHGIRSSDLKMGECADGFVDYDSTMVEDFLELGGGFAALLGG